MRFFKNVARYLCLASASAWMTPALATDYLGDLDHHDIGRNALWHVVHDLCRTSAKLGLSFPCLTVEQAKSGSSSGWATLQVGPDHILTTPTEKVTGIESPTLFEAGFPNLWQVAWATRKDMAKVESGFVPRDRIAVVVNSMKGRSQDQLHIHTSCIRKDVASTLSKNLGHLTTSWTRLKTPLHGINYQARLLKASDLSGIDLFHDIPIAQNGYTPQMGLQTIIAIGATFSDGSEGFMILNDQAHGWDTAHGEALLDKDCSDL